MNFISNIWKRLTQKGTKETQINNSSITKKQHYIPIFILQHFTNSIKRIFEVLLTPDSKNQKIYPTNPKSSMCKKFAYEYSKLKPNTILFLDTVSMDKPPAAIKLIQGDEIPHYGFSTHNMSPKLMIENIKSQIKVKIFMLGIQPKSLEFGEEISKEVLEKIVFLENIFMEILGKNEKQK